MEHIGSNREFNRKTEALKIIYIYCIFNCITFVYDELISPSNMNRKKKHRKLKYTKKIIYIVKRDAICEIIKQYCTNEKDLF